MSSTHEHRELIDRVAQFDIDEGQPSLSFERRLARENGWSVGYARRVVDEYKRFAILAVVAGHSVTPSEDVDQAWHLHLTYTRSYWQRFCRDALKTDLHHNPTAGGQDEQEKFFDWYAKTLDSYRRIFGTSPPSDIWPPPEKRFAHAGEGRWIQPNEEFVLPKRTTLTTLAIAAGGLVLVTVAGCQPRLQQVVNPFNFDGPSFLAFYAFLAIIALPMVAILHRLPSRRPGAPDLNWEDPYLVACLAGGPRATALAVITKLVARGNLRLGDKPSTLGKMFRGSQRPIVPGNPPDEFADRIEKWAFAEVVNKQSVDPPSLVRAILPEAEIYSEQLWAAGMTNDPQKEPFYKTRLPDLIISGLFLVGGIKLVVGIMRDRPVGFLIAMLVVIGILALLARRTPRQTRAGKRKVNELQQQYASLNPAQVTTGGAGLVGDSAALAAGLFGVAALAHYDGLSELGTELGKIRDGGGGWLGGDGGCGSDGGGGCGGGGCGGCGGCGG